MKFAIVLLALVGYAVAQDDGDLIIVCRDNTVVQHAIFHFGTGLSGCVLQKFGQYIGYRCKFTGFSQKLYIKLMINEGRNQLFAPSLTIHTNITNIIDFTIKSNIINDCVTCNMTEYSGFDTSICNAQTYWNTDDFENGSKCLAQEYPSKSNLVTETYYYKMPLDNSNVQDGSKIQVDVKIGQDPLVCSTLVELRSP